MPQRKRPARPFVQEETRFGAVPNPKDLAQISQQQPNSIVNFLQRPSSANRPSPATSSENKQVQALPEPPAPKANLPDDVQIVDPTGAPNAAANNSDQSNSQEPSATKPKLSKKQIAEPSSLARQRKLKRRAPTRSRRKPKYTTAVALTTRLQQFPDQMLRVDGYELFYECCHNRPLTNKHSTIANHVISKSHVENKALFTQKTARQKQLQEMFHRLAFMENRNAPASQQVRRFEVVSALLESGISLHKLECRAFTDILEEKQPKLGGSSTLADFIPLVRVCEFRSIQQELNIPVNEADTFSLESFLSPSANSSESKQAPAPQVPLTLLTPQPKSASDSFVGVFFF